MPNSKPILTAKEQVEHLKKKGVKFNVMSEADAERYLMYQSNYFKVAAYRKNWQKYLAGENTGKYMHLEFAHLVDLATIDMHLRYQIVLMALDIEHHAKLRLLREAEHYREDGYAIVRDYIQSMPPKQGSIFQSEIQRSESSIYCGDIVRKYNNHFPIWAFMEVIPFGRLVSFYQFCAKRFNDPVMSDDYYLLLTTKQIRNAAAHSNCILNDLHAGSAKHKTNARVTQALAAVNNVSTRTRKNCMSNVRIQQIVTLFYTHMTFVKSVGLQQKESAGLRIIMDRMNEHADYYTNNQLVNSTLTFLRTLIDNWA